MFGHPDYYSNSDFIHDLYVYVSQDHGKQGQPTLAGVECWVVEEQNFNSYDKIFYFNHVSIIRKE